ncbi:bacterial transcriptional activator domain-containing protein [Spirillospora sp. NPDC047279]|uniref:bacterial transcriptional activator domain-containing protein n=1 Tax=Spirillospora sp. NPDC047279 TaxID=3155478 RepID=UPI0033C1191A
MKVRGRRSVGDVLAGIGAIAALVALVGGVPWALLTFFEPPVPDHVPTASDLTGQIGPGALMTVLVALVWLAWLQLALCVLVEVYAGIRGVGVPARVPLAGGTQSLVHRLVVAALLLFTATSAIMPAFGGGGLHSQRPVQTQAQEFRPVQPAVVAPRAAAVAVEHQAPATAAQPTAKSPTTKIYRVQPPEGRHHESLWEIADKCLGEGRRYKEIYALNKGRVQPDGSKLSIASLIRPGWVLEMPADAKGAQVIPVKDLDDYFRTGHAGPPEPVPRQPAPETPAPRSPAPPPAAETPAPEAPAPETPAPETPAPETRAPETQAPQAPAPEQPVPEQPAPETPAPQAPAPGAAAPAQPPAQAPEEPPASQAPAPRPSDELGGGAGTGGANVPGQDAQQEEHAPLPFDLEWPQGLAAASLLAAGLLSALGRRRRTQMWHRAFGQMIVRPEGRAAQTEQALRMGADKGAVELLDLGLRHLSKSLAAEGQGQGRALPTVYGVHLGNGSLDLWVAPADRNPPAPWEAYDDGQVWRLRGDALNGLRAADLGDVLAPYPGLVSIGTNQNGRILVDLEAAHGLIALQGPPDVRRSVLAALALELATNRWSDHMRITLVGFGAELGEGLAEVAPDRIRTVATLDQALPELEGRSEEVRQALAASGVDSVLTGRCRGVFGEAWMPHYLIMADQPTEREADRLVALARTGTRMAAGYIVPGDVQGATWTWEVDATGRMQAGVLGFQVDAQLVPEEHYRGVFELFRTAGRLESVPLSDPASDIGGAEPPGTHQSSVDIRLLGPIEVDAPGPMDDTRRALCTEVLVYLATHPGGVHPTVLSGAIWPRGVTTGVRDACVARVSDWLGRDARGRPNLYYDDRGRIKLGSEVRVDWAVFRWLVWRSAAEPASETAYMSYALDLVRGPVLADRPRGRYGWLANDDLEYEAGARVIDVAHRLVVLRLEEGDARGAVGAARAGLRLAPEDEGLWRDLLRSTHATGDEAQVQVVIDELRSRVGRDPLLDQLQPETEALVEELMPQWHRLQAR